MNKKIVMGVIAILIAALIVLKFFVKNENIKKETNGSKTQKEISLEMYPYANSTDIYSLSGRYALDGTKRIALPFLQNTDESVNIAYVNDEWLYYYEYDEEEGGPLKRIPLHKGKDNRDVVDEAKAQVVRNTKNENGFVVHGNYYAGVSYGTVVMLLDIETNQAVRKKVPDEIAYAKDVVTEDKYWGVLEQGENWILWEGDSGVMLQLIPSGEVYVIERKPVTMVKGGKDCFYYSTDSKSCYKYDLSQKEKVLCFKESDIQKIISEQLKISEREKISCRIDNILTNDSKIYWQIKVRYPEKAKESTQYIVLSYGENGNQPVIDRDMEDILEAVKNGRFLTHIGAYWYLYNGEYMCYDERTKKYKKIDMSAPEWNVAYAVSALDDLARG